MANTTWMASHTGWSDFILMGLFRRSKHPALLCVVIFVVFLMALSGNAVLILLIHSDAHLHTPMYVFIRQLSLMDMVYISVTVPKMLLDQVMGVNQTSAPECGMQMFLYVTLASSEFFLLAAMASDRYVAICHPLRYPVLMTHRVCLFLASGCWFLGSVDGFTFTPITMTFPFCRPREIHHFFCEVPAVTVLMNSAEGQKKAFATCSSHLTVVILFSGAAIYTYMLPSSYHTPEKDMMISVFCTILTPVLNPLIYSLRNKDVMGALKKMFIVI
uniref:G-protein coupled receptors family 1 profile domain-containing protein n=1 Tax=Colobus angolensis palliatus TaxID=336983 RepID=A0A2K5J412_COLAP